MGAEVSAAQPMSASSGSLVDSNGGVLINAGRPTSEEQALGGTTGFVAGVMAGRKLQQTNVSCSSSPKCHMSMSQQSAASGRQQAVKTHMLQWQAP